VVKAHLFIPNTKLSVCKNSCKTCFIWGFTTVVFQEKQLSLYNLKQQSTVSVCNWV